jgi:hypothetical protein
MYTKTALGPDRGVVIADSDVNSNVVVEDWAKPGLPLYAFRKNQSARGFTETLNAGPGARRYGTLTSLRRLRRSAGTGSFGKSCDQIENETSPT